MKRQLTALAMAAVMAAGMSVAAYAAISDTCAMSVTVTVSKSVTVTDDPLTFPAVAAGAGNAVVSNSAALVTNDGTTTESYRLQLTEKPAAWNVKENAGNPGTEEIKLLALFTSDAAPASASFGDTEDLVKASATTDASGTVYAVNAEAADLKGLNCTATAVRRLWFKFMAPASTVLGGAAQWLTVTVTAF